MNYRIISIFIVVVFLCWIVPLGAFIESAKEEAICNGKRAICLCMSLYKKQASQVKDVLKELTQTARTKTSQGSPSIDFINFILFFIFGLQINRVFGFELLKRLFRFCKQIDPVPILTI